nr:spore germination protein [Paenibacillus hamazuiensis]
MVQQLLDFLSNERVWIGGLVAFLVPWGLSRMFRLLLAYRMTWGKKGRGSDLKDGGSGTQSESSGNDEAKSVTGVLGDKLHILNEAIGHNPDVVFRSFLLEKGSRNAAIVYIDGLVDMAAIQEQVIKPLMQAEKVMADPESGLPLLDPLKEYFMKTVISLGHLKMETRLDACISEILSGNCVLLIDGANDMMVLNTSKPNGRSIDEPVTEAVIRGPHEGFVEILHQNIPLLRRRIKDPNLTIIPYKTGRRSQTNVAVIYIKDLCENQLVDEVRRRIEAMDIDDVLESGYIEQMIEDNYLSFFPQVQSTERPDRAASALLEGRVAILTDGSPKALIVPVTFQTFVTAPDDYYDRWLAGSLIRLLRYLAVFMALFLPSIYIAMISYNHGLIPTKLAISIASGREGVPFPSLIEALMMEMTIEILREAGIRLPKPIGQAVGIVGGLVIGQAAVQAGIVSPIMVIVVSLTAMCSFAIAQYEMGLTIRTLRFFSMMSAGIFGIYGIILFVIIITVHAVKLQSFGVPYTSPIGPYRLRGWKDLFVRLPLPFLKQHKQKEPRG